MSWSTENIEKLIDGYSNYPELYAIKNADYHNKQKRQLAVSRVLKSLERRGTTATELQKKCNGLRTTYIAERRKLLQSCRSEAGGDEIYKPKLWYYNKLEFLNDHVVVRQSTSSFELDIGNQAYCEVEDVDGDYIVQEDNSLRLTSSMLTTPPAPSPQSDISSNGSSQKKKKKNIDAQDELQHQATAALSQISEATAVFYHKTKPADEDDVYGSYVAARLKNIKSLVNKYEIKHQIDKLLFEAQMAELQK